MQHFCCEKFKMSRHTINIYVILMLNRKAKMPTPADPKYYYLVVSSQALNIEGHRRTCKKYISIDRSDHQGLRPPEILVSHSCSGRVVL